MEHTKHIETLVGTDNENDSSLVSIDTDYPSEAVIAELQKLKTPLNLIRCTQSLFFTETDK